MNLRCPNCDSYKTTTSRVILLALAITSGFVGVLLSPFLIGIPVLILGIILFPVAILLPKKHVCRDCNHTWKPSK